MFQKMPFILLGLMLVIGGLHPWIPIHVQSIFYGLSLFIKSVIVFVLPCIIFGLLFKAAIGFARNASKTISVILVSILASNFVSTMISYFVGRLAYQCDLTMSFPDEAAGLLPAFLISLPKWIGNDTAMISALILGVVLARLQPSWASRLSNWVDWTVGRLLKGMLYVIPLFLSGFFIKMCHDRVIGSIIQNYGFIFCITACFLFGYIALVYFLGSRGGNVSLIQSIKNMLPAAIAGFGSMSSAAAMPLTILATEKNSRDPELARSIIPATANVHLIGDCFAIPIFAFAVMKSFGVSEPAFMSYFIFACYFVLAKFSVAAVPGGGILVMLPILETHLGFNSTMLSLITALYILFDPVITSANVLGNGGFAMNLSKLFARKKNVNGSKKTTVE